MKAYSQFVINVHHQNILDQLDHKYLSLLLSPFCPSSTPSFPPFTYLFLSLLHSHPLFPYISLTLSFLDFCYSILVSKLLHILNCSPLVSVSLSFPSLPPSPLHYSTQNYFFTFHFLFVPPFLPCWGATALTLLATL